MIKKQDNFFHLKIEKQTQKELTRMGLLGECYKSFDEYIVITKDDRKLRFTVYHNCIFETDDALECCQGLSFPFAKGWIMSHFKAKKIIKVY